MKHKVLIDGRVLIPRRKSGVGHYVSSLLKSLDVVLSNPSLTNTCDVRILIPFRAKEMVEREMNFTNIRFRSIPLPFRGMNLLSRYNLLPWLDVFYGKGLYIFPSFTKERLLHSKSVVFFYDLAYEKFPDSIHPKQLMLLESKGSEALNSDGIVTISHAMAEELSERTSPSSRIVIAEPAVDTRIFYKRSIDEIISVKNRLRLSGAYILTVGNLEPRKNMQTLVKAYKSLSPEMRDRYSLVIVGAESWKSDSTKQSIKEAQREGYNIKLFLGSIDDADLPVLYSGASVFVLPSLNEGYGIPIIEAMACRVPVISGSDSATVEAGGGASVIVEDILDPVQLANAIEGTLTNEEYRHDLINQGVARVEELQDWRKPAEVLYKLITELNEAKT